LQDWGTDALGPYDVDRLIGRGGMGEVYLARHRHLRRQVALKILQPELADNEDFRSRFVRESQSAAALHHPNIVTVYDAGETDGLLYIAMQYVDGPDLATVLHHDGPLPAVRCMVIVEQLADALDAAHARGLIHRDVKPGNVLIDDEHAYLTDFGLTKPVAVKTAVTKPGTLVGTVDYIAPEQIRGAAIDTRADVYSLGCLMYRTLAGESPFPRDNEMSVIHAHLYDPPPRITAVRPDLPPAMDVVIATALAKRPEERFAGASALAIAADHALSRRAPVGEEQPTAVVPAGTSAERPTGPTARLGRIRIRPRLPSVGVAAALVGLGVAAVLALLVTSSGGDGPTTTAGTTRSRPPTTTAAVGAAQHLVANRPVHVGYKPAGLAVGVGGLYVANEGDGTLRRIDAITSRLDSMKSNVGGGPSAVAAGAGGVWVTNRMTNSLTRVDPRTMTTVARIPVGRGPNAVAIGNHDYAVWVSNEQDGTVMRVDANTNAVDAKTPVKVGHHPRALATSPSWVFVANRSDGTVSRINVKTRKLAGTVATGKRPTSMVIASKSLWVANAGDGTVARVDMKRNRVVGRTHVGGHPYALAPTARYVFVADRARGRVVRINAQTGKLEGNAVPVRDPVAMRSGGGSIWIANRATGNVTRIELF
jgi:YVTN family beta-propeller protein